MRLVSFLRKALLGISALPNTMVRGGESAIRISRTYEVSDVGCVFFKVRVGEIGLKRRSSVTNWSKRSS